MNVSAHQTKKKNQGVILVNEEQVNKRKKANWNIRPYLAVGLISLLVIALSIMFFFLIYRYNGLAENWKKLMGILQPISIGLIIAYLINLIVKLEEKYLLPLFEKWFKRPEKAKKAARGISVAGAILFMLVIIGVLLQMVLPELFFSIEKMVVQLPGQVDTFFAWAETYFHSDGEWSQYLEQGLSKAVEYFENWAKTDFLPQTKNMLASLTTGVISVVKVLFNFIIGIIVSVYVLMSKETFVGQVKKLIYTLMPADKGNVVVATVRKSNEIFGGFISGKILDSAIIGVLCFIGLSILKMPYALLVSVIVGVTNIIPFFGPYIGAIPSALLIMLANPLQGLYFIIFILVLQQLDGNVIGPRILGESTGLSSFWVIFAILIGGGLFGFMGMILGVPVFATFYYLMQKLTAYILRKKGLPEQSEVYIEVTKVDPVTKQLDYTRPEEPPKRNRRKSKVKKEEKEEKEEK